MECRRWTFAAIIVYLSFKDSRVLCQNVSPDATNTLVRNTRDCSRACGNPTSTELYNSILNMAASNGVLPDLLPMLQGQPVVDNLQRFPSAQEFVKPLSVVPMPASGCGNTQEPIILSNQPIRPPPSNQNIIVATPLPCGSGCPPNAIPLSCGAGCPSNAVPFPCGSGCPLNSIPQTVAPSLSTSTCVPKIAQPVPLESYPTCTQNGVRPMPIVLQPQCQFSEVNPYNVYNQILEPISYPEVNTQSLNLPILPPSQILPAINPCSGNLELNTNVASPCLPPPAVLSGDCQQLPLNLQINVPTPSVPAPRITVVSTTPQNTPVTVPAPYYSDLPGNLPYQYPPQPPVIIGGGSKSSWRNLLPIILVALFSDRGYNNGGGSCCCCCNGGSSGNNIPIPYPIPIPVNNPVINSCPYPYSSRGREFRDDGDDDDEDRKRK